MIYFDQAATSFPKAPGVPEAVCQALQTMGNSGRGAHHLALEANRLVFRAREHLAQFFKANDPARIAFTANATESLNLALEGLLKPGQHVLTTELEHNSVLRPLYRLKAQGVEVSVVPSDQKGIPDFAQLEQLLRPNTKAVVCTAASNVTGNVTDLDYLGDFCSRRGLAFILDAAQTAGSFPLDVKRQKIDILCFSGHKGLLGPQGVGGIYLREGLELRPLKVGGSGMQSYSTRHPSEMPEALEAGTLNTPGIAGLLAGLKYLNRVGLEQIRSQEQELTRLFYLGAKDLPGVKIYGDFSTFRRCPIVALSLSGLDSAYVSQVLAQDFRIQTRAGSHCAPLMHRALGTEKEGLVRFSFSHFNTKEEIKIGLRALQQIVTRKERN